MSEVQYWWVWRPSLSKADMGALDYHKVVLASDYDRNLAEMRRQRDAYEAALLKIASCPCTNTVSPCRPPYVCVTCIARAALNSKEPHDD
ncbi:MAG: hypothetical protein KGL39_14560 [Patescibacteria group bacterium]|nr:hypothetical protein [Patescibacteria group bacterium]